MRWSCLVLAPLGVWLALEAEAAATSCFLSYPWLSYGSSTFDDAPVDIRPYMRLSCYDRDLAQELGYCRFTAGEHEVAVEFEPVGLASCAVEADGPSSGDYLVSLVPQEPLLPGRTYKLGCTELSPNEVFTVITRDDDAPAAAPEELKVTSATLTQGDPTGGCCGGVGDTLEIELHDFETLPFLAEGGFIEVVFADGRTFWYEGYDGLDADLVLPPDDGPIELTPIGASGERGPTTVLEDSGITQEAVYVPCAVTSGDSSFALWLLAPFAWMTAARRPRRRTA